MATKLQHQLYLASVETKLKADKRLSRSIIQDCVNALKYKKMDLEEKKVAITDMVKRLEIKVIGFPSLYTPRMDMQEKEKTLDFLDDLKSYFGFDK